MASLNPFGALANVFVPTAQTLGTYQQLNQIEQEQMARKASRERGIDAILADLGPEYEVFRKARAAGMSDDDLVPLIGGDIGKNIRASFVAKKAADIANSLGTYQDKVNRALASGLITADQAMGFLKPPSANSEFDQYRAAHPEMSTDEAVSTYAQIHNRPEKPQIEKFTVADPTTGTNVEKPMMMTPTGLVPIPIAGAPEGGMRKAYSSSDIAAMESFQNSRQMLEGALNQLQGAKKSFMGKPGAALVGKELYAWGVPSDRGDLYTSLTASSANLQAAAMRAAGTRAYSYARYIQDHYPNAGFSDEANRQRLESWLRPGGFLDIMDKSIRFGSPLPALSSIPGIPKAEASRYDAMSGGGAASPGAVETYRKPDGSTGRKVWVP